MKKLLSVLFFIVFLQLLCLNLAAQCDSVKDIDGNIYHAVKIGKQCWLKENLKTTRFRDGSPIPEIEDSLTWANINRSPRPAWCYYQGNDNYDTIYGKLYNWYAATDPRDICPAGWHVPSDADFRILTSFLGGDSVAGRHLKAPALGIPPRLADNSSGFSALSGGLRSTNGYFRDITLNGIFWSTTPEGSYDAMHLGIDPYTLNAYHSENNMGYGLSIRCIKD